MTKGMMEAPDCFQIFQGSTSAMLVFFGLSCHGCIFSEVWVPGPNVQRD